MPPGADAIVQNATAQSGWAMGALVLIALVVSGYVVLDTKQTKKELRELNKWVRDDMAVALNSVALAFSRFTRNRPCLHDSDTLLEETINEDADDVDDVGRRAKMYLKKVQDRRSKHAAVTDKTDEASDD